MLHDNVQLGLVKDKYKTKIFKGGLKNIFVPSLHNFVSYPYMIYQLRRLHISYTNTEYIVPNTVINNTVINNTVINNTVINNTVINNTVINNTVINNAVINNTVINNTVINDIVMNTLLDSQVEVYISSYIARPGHLCSYLMVLRADMAKIPVCIAIHRGQTHKLLPSRAGNEIHRQECSP